MNKKQWFYFLILFFCFCTLATAQSPHFRQHNFEKNLGNIQAKTIFQDKTGKHWIGTQQGLYFFDGLKYTGFLLPDSVSNHVTAIGAIAQTLWIGYDDGQIYYFENDKLTLFNPEEGLPIVRITGILEDKNGVIWFSTYGEGLYYYRNNRLYNFDTDDGLLGDDIYTMAMDSLGRIWVGTDGGISICSLKKEKKHIENLTISDGLPDMIVTKIITADAENMWIGTYEKGVCQYNLKQKRFEYITENWEFGVVNSLTLFEKKELWIGTNRDGLIKMSLNNPLFYKITSYDGVKILDTHKDIEGNFWVISNRFGVQSANKQFEFLRSNLKNIQAILCTKNGVQYVGNQDGFFKYLPDNQQYINLIPQENIISLHEDPFGNIWLGTFGNGVICYDVKTKKTKRITIKDGLPNGSILAMEGNEKTVWLATLGGVVRYNLTKNVMTETAFDFNIFRKKDGLGASYVYDIFIDKKGRVWFGTDGQGVSMFDNQRFTNYDNANGQPIKTVYTITEDHIGHIWFSTAKDGIYEFDGQHFKQFAYKQGLRDLEINSLITDENGNILILHPTGIDLLNPRTKHLIYYGEEVGISTVEPNLNVADTDKNGTIWLGTKTGIIQYLPLHEPLEIHPHTILQQVSVYLEPVALDVFSFQKENIFSHYQNHFTFDFIGLWYTDPKAVQYRYRLKGYDLDWNYTKDLRATYPNLPAGKYTFELQSSENQGFEGVPTVRYKFVIRLPFWKTSWFIGLSILVVSSLIYWLIKVREQRLKIREALKKEKIEFELQTLKSQVNPHFLFNSFNTLLGIVEEDAKMAAEYVEKLSDFYRNILQYQEQTVIQLQEELTLLENYFYLLQKRHGDNIQLKIKVIDAQLNRYLPPLTLQMLVENAVKHNTISKSKPLTIVINGNVETELSIKNELQIKKTPPISTYFGLKSIQKRYELLENKQIMIHKTATFFEVIVPLLKDKK